MNEEETVVVVCKCVADWFRLAIAPPVDFSALPK
jgi:hypothetical protein